MPHNTALAQTRQSVDSFPQRNLAQEETTRLTKENLEKHETAKQNEANKKGWRATNTSVCTSQQERDANSVAALAKMKAIEASRAAGWRHTNPSVASSRPSSKL